MKRKVIIENETTDAQQSLETILRLEIEVAEWISNARDQAEQKVSAAQKSTADLKTRMVDEARAERDHLFSEGVAKARALADERLKKAGQEAGHFKEVGKAYENEAADVVLQLIMGVPPARGDA